MADLENLKLFLNDAFRLTAQSDHKDVLAMIEIRRQLLAQRTEYTGHERSYRVNAKPN